MAPRKKPQKQEQKSKSVGPKPKIVSVKTAAPRTTRSSQRLQNESPLVAPVPVKRRSSVKQEDPVPQPKFKQVKSEEFKFKKSVPKTKNVKFVKQEQDEDIQMENQEESKDLDMLAFSQFVEAKFKTLDEEEDVFMTPVVQSDIQKMRQDLLKQNKLSHNFTPKTPGKPSQVTQYEPKEELEMPEELEQILPQNSLLGQRSGQKRINLDEVFTRHNIGIKKEEPVQPMKPVQKGQIFDQQVPKKEKIVKAKALGQFEESSSGYLPMRLPYHGPTEVQENHQIINNKEPMLLQMPCSLPFKQIKEMQKIGKIRLMKSGKVILRIGEIDLDVSKGIDTTFYQELVSISNGQISMLGQIKQKMVVTPQII